MLVVMAMAMVMVVVRYDTHHRHPVDVISAAMHWNRGVTTSERRTMLTNAYVEEGVSEGARYGREGGMVW